MCNRFTVYLCELLCYPTNSSLGSVIARVQCYLTSSNHSFLSYTINIIVVVRPNDIHLRHSSRLNLKPFFSSSRSACASYMWLWSPLLASLWHSSTLNLHIYVISEPKKKIVENYISKISHSPHPAYKNIVYRRQNWIFSALLELFFLIYLLIAVAT